MFFSVVRFLRLSIYTLLFLFGIGTVLGSLAAIFYGETSLAGRSSSLLVNKFWIENFGQSAVYFGMNGIQIVLGISLMGGALLACFRQKSKWIVISIVTFFLFSIFLDLARIGYTWIYALLILGKYAVYGMLIEFLRRSYRFTDKNSL